MTTVVRETLKKEVERVIGILSAEGVTKITAKQVVARLLAQNWTGHNRIRRVAEKVPGKWRAETPKKRDRPWGDSEE